MDTDGGAALKISAALAFLAEVVGRLTGIVDGTDENTSVAVTSFRPVLTVFTGTPGATAGNPLTGDAGTALDTPGGPGGPVTEGGAAENKSAAFPPFAPICGAGGNAEAAGAAANGTPRVFEDGGAIFVRFVPGGAPKKSLPPVPTAAGGGPNKLAALGGPAVVLLDENKSDPPESNGDAPATI